MANRFQFIHTEQYVVKADKGRRESVMALCQLLFGIKATFKGCFCDKKRDDWKRNAAICLCDGVRRYSW